MPISFDNSYARLPAAFYSPAQPTKVAAPEFIAFNRHLAAELGMDLTDLDEHSLLGFFSGNEIPRGAEPIAMVYAGHQFGGFSPRLGDGRAILLGEVLDREGKRRDLQLKGAGPTPYSRRGDGRSALGPVLREYLLSEAMAALGVPTTRALAAVWTGEKVFREQPEPGGVFTRVAGSHLRIGTVEYFAARGEKENLQILIDYIIQRHYPQCLDSPNPALALLDAVSQRQARLIAQWMGFGFIHGVMNTDNMSLSGETIDYGPCAFLDRYDPEKKFSYIDQFGRYAFGNQPVIARWNLARLAEALLVSFNAEQPELERAVAQAGEILETFPIHYESAWKKIFSAKLGFKQASPESTSLARELLSLLHQDRVDFTIAFRQLARAAASGDWPPFTQLFDSKKEVIDWIKKWRHALQSDSLSESDAGTWMLTVNPAIIPRNHRVEEVIQAARNHDFGPFRLMLEALGQPYADQPSLKKFEEGPQPNEEVTVTFCGT